ncbi:carbonic anhydrase [Magnetospirillum molischianum]|uniref:Carbonic anhydrase n=1 Tax=Magnetospirillum molischianum DSM 120 TaxID=1150626 RepID=H8FXK3_MAGML|nr:carbonic anhydrase [Magnetospirillum molischianum]CCG43091.1 Carbonic anhydrase [Magnetospirillum molischianum DSM 120]
MERLIEGFQHFRATYFEENKTLFETLAQSGQKPKALLIGCSDSRVDPGLLFGTQPGEMFVIRNVANLVPPFETTGTYHGTSAAIEFAIRRLEVEHAVVLGHAGCGGVRALIEQSAADGTNFVRPWMDIARTARDRCLALAHSAGKTIDYAREMCEKETVAVSLANLMTFPWIRERVEQKRLTLHGWWFDVEKGTLWRLDCQSNTFQQIA